MSSTHDVFPDIEERKKLGGTLNFNVRLGEIGVILTALEDAGFEVEINVVPKVET